MTEEFISEQIKPVAGTSDPNAMLQGLPGLPQRFRWRDQEYILAEVLETWKEDGPCKSGGPEKYLRKHWYKIKTIDGTEMKIYFERQLRSQSHTYKRWWLYTICRMDS